MYFDRIGWEHPQHVVKVVVVDVDDDVWHLISSSTVSASTEEIYIERERERHIGTIGQCCNPLIVHFELEYV